MAPRCVAALLVVLVAVVQASSEKLINPYVNVSHRPAAAQHSLTIRLRPQDYVAVPDVMSMVQMKTGMQAGVKMAATIGGDGSQCVDHATDTVL